MKTTAVVGIAGGDAHDEASVPEITTADVAAIHHEAKIPQQPEV
jgi:hypothetical protein